MMDVTPELGSPVALQTERAEVCKEEVHLQVTERSVTHLNYTRPANRSARPLPSPRRWGPRN